MQIEALEEQRQAKETWGELWASKEFREMLSKVYSPLNTTEYAVKVFNEESGSETLRDIVWDIIHNEDAVSFILNQKPFRNMADVVETFDQLFSIMNEQDFKKTFANMPPIGKIDPTNKYFVEDRIDRSEEFDKYEQAYEDKFKRVFILCVCGLTREEVIQSLRNRIHNEPDVEFKICEKEIRKMAHLRIPIVLNTFARQQSRLRASSSKSDNKQDVSLTNSGVLKLNGNSVVRELSGSIIQQAEPPVQAVQAQRSVSSDRENDHQVLVVRSDEMTETGPNISSHVLDLTIGKPAQGLRACLFVKGELKWELLGKDETDQDGRMRNLLNGHALSCQEYKIVFMTEEYFEKRNAETFYPNVEVKFRVKNATQSYHIPLLLNQFGYSTYRGS